MQILLGCWVEKAWIVNVIMYFTSFLMGRRQQHHGKRVIASTSWRAFVGYADEIVDCSSRVQEAFARHAIVTSLKLS